MAASKKEQLTATMVQELLQENLREAGMHDLEVVVKDESDGCGQSLVIIVVSDEFGGCQRWKSSEARLTTHWLPTTPAPPLSLSCPMARFHHRRHEASRSATNGAQGLELAFNNG